MDKPKIIELGYWTCNKDSIVLCILIVIILTVTIFILKLIAMSEYYNSIGVAVPAFYYFGDKRAMRALTETVFLNGITTKSPFETYRETYPDIAQYVYNAFTRVKRKYASMRDAIAEVSGKINADFVDPMRAHYLREMYIE